jgi:hypothetical protein
LNLWALHPVIRWSIIVLREGGEFLMVFVDVLQSLGGRKEVDAIWVEVNEPRARFDMFGEGVKFLLDIMYGHLVKWRPDSFPSCNALTVKTVGVEGGPLGVFPIHK